MGSPSPAPLPLGRLAGVGAVVFLANAGLLVLQLVAGRLLAPFLGSDLYTWTTVIGVFLTGIALGNAYGGRLADRFPSPRTLAAVLAVGSLAAAWMALFPSILTETQVHRNIPLDPRIPLLTGVLCLPAGFVLSLLTPVAIKLGLPDVSKAGRVAGMVFALSTLGCLLGNYLTGFYLIPALTINSLVYATAGALLTLSLATLVVMGGTPPPNTLPASGRGDQSSVPPSFPPPRVGEGPGVGSSEHAFADIRRAYLIVFLASFGGMTLELTASRVLAVQLGVSLYTWTGIIGVMLAGTAGGNLLGGLLADWANRPGSGRDPRATLAGSLVLAGAAVALVLLTLVVLKRMDSPFSTYGLVGQVLILTFALFFLPMFLLGTVSPQVIRLAVRDEAHAGRVAGRVYAWSTAGAIAGTFAAGYVLLSTLGANRTILGVAAVLVGAAFLVTAVWRANLLLYATACTLGVVVGGTVLTRNGIGWTEDTVAVRETNYYTIKVTRDYEQYAENGPKFYTGGLNLSLDHLLHSIVKPADPTYIYYTHEHIQMELLRAARAETPAPRVLLVGGGGYTFPRYAKTLLPETVMDVVEIDPGVTRAAYDHLGLQPGLTNDFNMDGRQFVAERAAPGSYDLVVLDAVNDLSVPAHLLTREYNDAVRRALKPDGAYLLTIIDTVPESRLWRSCVRTLRETFAHVHLLYTADAPNVETDGTGIRAVYVLYASDRPLDLDRVGRAAGHATAQSARAAVVGGWAAGPTDIYTHIVRDEHLAPHLKADPGVLLTDQYAPVDNLMADTFRRR